MTPQQQQQALHQQQILQQQGLHHQQALQQQALHQQQQALLQPALQQQQQPALQQQALPPLPEPTDEEMDYLLNLPPRKSPSPRIVKDVVMSEDPESPGYKFFKWALKRQKDFNAPPTAMFDQGLWREFLNSRVGKGGLFPEPSKYEEEEDERVLSPLTKKKDMLQKLEQMTIEYNDAYEKTQAMLDYYKKSRDDYYKRTF